MRLDFALALPRRRYRLVGAVACLLGLLHGAVLAQNQAQSACGGEQSRPLGISALQSSERSALQIVCSSGSVDRVNLTAELGVATALSIDLQQSAFADSIYHVDIRDLAQRPISWIEVAPPAGELSNTGTASIELVMNPPAELISSVQTIVVSLTIHDGSKSWSRDLELQITISEEQPLFRSRFEIDPVIGQFSYKAPVRRSAPLAAATASGD